MKQASVILRLECRSDSKARITTVNPWDLCSAQKMERPMGHVTQPAKRHKQNTTCGKRKNLPILGVSLKRCLTIACSIKLNTGSVLLLGNWPNPCPLLSVARAECKSLRHSRQ